MEFDRELMEGQKEYRRKVTIMQMKMKAKDDIEDNEVYKISKKVIRSSSLFHLMI